MIFDFQAIRLSRNNSVMEPLLLDANLETPLWRKQSPVAMKIQIAAALTIILLVGAIICTKEKKQGIQAFWQVLG